MKRSSILGVVLALAALAAPALAGAAEVAKVLTFSGTLRTSTGAVETAYKDITFKLYAASEGGTALFTETLGVQPSTDGTFSVKIGSTATLDAALFAQQLYLGIQVTGEAEMVPRTQLTPTPYTWSVDWASLRGFPAACPPGQFVTGLGPTLTCSTPPQAIAAVQGQGVITATTSSGTVTVSLATAGCSLGQVLKFGALGWACADDADTDTGLLTVSRNATLVGDGTAGAPLGLMTCSTAGHVLKWSGSAWACQPDADTDTGLTSVVVASPITGNGAGTPLGLTSCPDGGILKATGTGWSCNLDADTKTVERDASLVGDGSAVSPLGVAFQPAEPSGGNGVATTAARSDHFHSHLVRLALADAGVTGATAPGFGEAPMMGMNVRGLLLGGGQSANWYPQMAYPTNLVPRLVTFSATVVGVAAPDFSVAVGTMTPGGDAWCILPAPSITYMSTALPQQGTMVKATFSNLGACGPKDDDTVAVGFTNNGDYIVVATVVNANLQIFF